jgi:hypothetical protein
VVLCSFRDLTTPEPLKNFSLEHAYAYRWGLSSPPFVGQWAVVEGIDGPATVIVGAIGANAYVEESGVDSLEVILRLVPAEDIEKARTVVERKRSDDLAAEATWLAHCRWVAGMDPERPARPLSASFEAPLLPTDEADWASADRHGANWWRAYKKAEELRYPAVEIERLKDIARVWFRIRDRGAVNERLSAVKNVATGVDLDRKIRELTDGENFDDRPGNFLGEPMWDWLRYVEELAKGGEAETGRALDLVYALIIVAEREAAASGREPAPAYTERAAILHRKRKEYDREVAVLERWEMACPPERRGPGALQSKLAQRLVKARELAKKKSGSGR